MSPCNPSYWSNEPFRPHLCQEVFCWCFRVKLQCEVSELDFHPPVLETDNYDVRECLGGEEKVGAWERNAKRKSRGRNNLNRKLFSPHFPSRVPYARNCITSTWELPSPRYASCLVHFSFTDLHVQYGFIFYFGATLGVKEVLQSPKN